MGQKARSWVGLGALICGLSLSQATLGQGGTLPEVDLLLNLSLSPRVTVVDTPFILTVRLENLGPEESPNGTLTLDLPESIPSMSLIEGEGSCALKEGALRCDLGAIPKGQERFLDFQGQSDAEGTFSLEGRISTLDAYDTALGNNAQVIDIPVVSDDDGARSDISLTIIEVGVAREPDDPFDLLYVINNAGPGPARTIDLSGDIEGDLEIASAFDPGGQPCDIDGNRFTCDGGDISPNGEATCTVQLLPTGLDGGIARGEAFTPLSADPNYGNNAFSLTLSPDGSSGGGDADLSLALIPPPSPGPLGGITPLDIRIQNIGPGDGSGVTFTLPLPEDMAFVAGFLGEKPCELEGDSIDCRLDVLQRGAEAFGTISLRASSLGDVTLQGQISSTSADPSPQNDSATAQLSITDQGQPPPEADVGVSLSTRPSPPVAGRSATITLTYNNDGPEDSGPLFTSVNLPIGLPVEVEDPGCIIEGGQLRCNLDALEAGGERAITLTLTPIDESSLNLSGEVFPQAVDPFLLNNRFEQSVTINPPGSGGPDGDLSLSLTGPERLSPAEVFTLEGALESLGPGVLPGVVATAAGADLDILALFGGLRPCIPAHSPCEIGSLPPGSSALTWALRAPDLDAPADGGSISALVSTDPSLGAVITAEAVWSAGALEGGAADDDAGLSLSFGEAQSPQVDQAFVLPFTLAKASSGGVSARVMIQGDASAELSLPEDIEGTWRLEGDVLIGEGLSLGEGEAINGQISIIPGRGGALHVGGVILGEDVREEDASDNVDWVELQVEGEALEVDLALLPRLGSASPRAGSPVYLLLDVLNWGPGDEPNPELSINLPEGASLGGDVAGCSSDDAAIFCDLEALAWGGSQLLTIPVVFEESGSYSINMTLGGSLQERAPGDNDATLDITLEEALEGDVDLTLTLDSPLEVARVGQAIPITATLSNRSDNSAPGARFEATLPEGVTLASGSGCDADQGALICTIGSLPGGASLNIDLSLRAADQGSFTLRATASSDARELAPVDNEGSLDLSIIPDDGVGYSDLSLSLSPSEEEAFLGLPIIVTATVVNKGPPEVEGASVEIPIPLGVNLESALGPEGACAISATTIECGLGLLPALGEGIVTLALTPTELGTLRVAASLNFDLHDPKPFDNDVAIDIPVVEGGEIRSADLAVAFESAPGSAVVGEDVNLSIVATNAGPDIASGVRIALSLPGSMTFISGRCGEVALSAEAGVVSCTPGVMDQGVEGRLDVVARVTAPGDVTVEGRISSLTDDPAPSNNEVDITLTLNPRPTPGLVASAQNLAPRRVAWGTKQVPALPFSLTVNDTEDLTLSHITLESSGTGDEGQDLTNLVLFLDENADGILNGSEASLAQGTFAADNGRAVLALPGGLTLPKGAATHLGVSVDISDTVNPPAMGMTGPTSPGPSPWVAALMALSLVPLLGLITSLKSLPRPWLRLGSSLLQRGLAFAVGALILLAPGCDAGEGVTSLTPATFALQVRAITAIGIDSGEQAEIDGLPLEGALLTVGLVSGE